MITLSDRSDIVELTHRYALYFDTAQIEPLMQLWTEDATMSETKMGLTAVQGHAALRTFFTNGRGSVDYAVHYVSNHLINEHSENYAKGVCFVFCKAQLKSGQQVEICGYYDDEYEKQNGQWKFKSRDVVPLMPVKLGDFAHAQT